MAVRIQRMWVNGEECTESGSVFAIGTFVTPNHLCPDLLRYEQIGAADGLRGQVVRAFFWIMRAWPVKS